MKTKNSKANLIILMIIVLLFLLLGIVVALLFIIQKNPSQVDSNGVIVTTQKQKTIKEIIEKHESKYLEENNDEVFLTIYALFKYDLYSTDGRSHEEYFQRMIDEIVDLQKDSFYLVDKEKNIKIFVLYDKNKDDYSIIINGIENYYKDTEGDTYKDIINVTSPKRTGMSMSNELIYSLQMKSMYYSNTILASEDREELGNGYYSYENGNILAKLSSGRVLNLLFERNYKEEIAKGVYVTTRFEDIINEYGTPTYGSVSEKYLVYKTAQTYTYFYEDEVSVYEYKYAANKDFDMYLAEYCRTGDLDKLVSDFTQNYQSYFDFEYDPDLKSLKLSYPQRGIDINITNNNSQGITIYKNYYLTDTVTSLIKSNKITLEPDKDLIEITESKRRESM